jgi:hypothetical protein
MPSPMTLGQIIDVLKRKKQDDSVRFDFVYFHPKGIHSYRGYYDQLAIGYSNEGDDPTVAELLKMCEDADGKDFTGYKGGTYTMDRDTVVWVANPNESGGTAIVDIHDDGFGIRLITACVD